MSININRTLEEITNAAYIVLGVSPNATDRERSDAYKVRSRLAHPDVAKTGYTGATFEELAAANVHITTLRTSGAEAARRRLNSRDFETIFDGIKTGRIPNTPTLPTGSRSLTKDTAAKKYATKLSSELRRNHQLLNLLAGLTKRDDLFDQNTALGKSAETLAETIKSSVDADQFDARQITHYALIAAALNTDVAGNSSLSASYNDLTSSLNEIDRAFPADLGFDPNQALNGPVRSGKRFTAAKFGESISVTVAKRFMKELSGLKYPEAIPRKVFDEVAEAVRAVDAELPTVATNSIARLAVFGAAAALNPDVDALAGAVDSAGKEVQRLGREEWVVTPTQTFEIPRPHGLV
jgi:hypothetical protein